MREAHRVSDGAGLLAAFRAAVANLERHVDEINDLNVFPVPDGDTGSNMLATVLVALEEAESVADRSAGRVAAALSLGALMGARGNSGVITSQICRGIAEGLDGKRRFTGLDLALALTRGAELAYAAVGKPVEGTILTVIREWPRRPPWPPPRTGRHRAGARPPRSTAPSGPSAATPTLLPILREAGVVDSGGQGVYRLLEGALLHVRSGGPRVDRRSGPDCAPGAAVRRRSPTPTRASASRRCSCSSRAPDATSIPTRSGGRFEAIGESVVVVGDERPSRSTSTVSSPTSSSSRALAMGSLSRISVENLDQQARDVREQRASEFTGPASPASRMPAIPLAPRWCRDGRRRPGGDLPRPGGHGDRPGRPVGQSQHRRPAGGDRGGQRPGDAPAAQQRQRDPGRPAGRRAHGPPGPCRADPQRGRGLCRPAGLRSGPGWRRRT